MTMVSKAMVRTANGMVAAKKCEGVVGQALASLMDLWRLAVALEKSGWNADLPRLCTSDFRAKALNLAHSLGVAVDEMTGSGPEFGPAWTGQAIAAKGMDYATIIHEVAHFMVAPRHRRSLVNYGLGAGVDQWLAAPRIPSARTLEEEARAGVLGVLYEIALGLGSRSPETLVEGDWTAESEDSARKKFQGVLGYLAQRGLIDTSGRPRL